MKLKEKNAAEVSNPVTADRNTSPAAMLFLSAFFGFLAAGTKLGGNGAPLCAALTAVLPPFDGLAAYAGAMAALLLKGGISERLTEVIAMPAVILARAMLASASGKKPSPAAAGVLAFSAYVICGTAVSFFFRVTAALILAVVFRGAICGGAAYLAAKLFRSAEKGTALSSGARLPAAAVYVLAVCMLCGIGLGGANAGRIAGAFVTAAAAYRYGFAGGAAAGALSAFSFGLYSPAMASSAAVFACGGLASGAFAKRNKLAAAAAFVLTALGGALVYGMPNDAVKLIFDMTAGAALFFVIPEKLYRIPSGRSSAPRSEAVRQCGDRLRFAAEAVSGVRDSFSKAAKVLEKSGRGSDISVSVCERVCSSCRSSAFCGENEEHRIRVFFRPAEGILKRKGFITERELHDGLEHCPKKSGLAETFNEMYRFARMERQSGDANALMRELTLEQLSETEELLKFQSGASERFPACDEALSARARELLLSCGAKSPSASALYDRDGRLFMICYFEGLLSSKLDALTEKLSAAADRELEEPAVVSEGGITRLCFHEPTVYEAETGHAAVSGKDGTSGDSDALFRDGMGGLWVMISDGMGSGVRAAVESRMTVSVLTRLIRSGFGAEAAVKLVNRLLMTKSPEEIFATADLLRIDLFTGKAEVIKLGGAQTFFKTNGTVKTVESRSMPVGMIPSPETDKRSVTLSDGDIAVMITDGIPEACFPRVRELMLSVGVTAQECAEGIVSEAEKGMENDPSRQDDKTVYVVKIHKI